MSKRKILITGGTGYIGNYVTKVIAATRPDVIVSTMSRRSIEDQIKKDPQTARFTNVNFIQGDCLKPETYPKDLHEYDAIIHTVGALMEGIDYKNIL